MKAAAMRSSVRATAAHRMQSPQQSPQRSHPVSQAPVRFAMNDAPLLSPTSAGNTAVDDASITIEHLACSTESACDSAGATTSSKLVLGQVRTNGFERPFARDQVISWTGHSVSAACFYFVAISYLVHGESTDERLGVRPLTLVALAIHVPTILLLLTAWVSCERIDPSKDVSETLPSRGWLGIQLTGPRWEKARYCALCRKSVPGLDHHCTWLQTCVGRANYAQFFTIACTGAIQFLSQTLFAAFCLVWLHAPIATSSVYGIVVESALIACLLISAPCTLMYLILLGFHVWLAWLGYGTYEWMLRRRKQKTAARKARDDVVAKRLSAADDTAAESFSSERTLTDPKEPVHDDVSRHASVDSDSNFVAANDDKSTKSAQRKREVTAL